MFPSGLWLSLNFPVIGLLVLGPLVLVFEHFISKCAPLLYLLHQSGSRPTPLNSIEDNGGFWSHQVYIQPAMLKSQGFIKLAILSSAKITNTRTRRVREAALLLKFGTCHLAEPISIITMRWNAMLKFLDCVTLDEGEVFLCIIRSATCVSKSVMWALLRWL